MQFVFNDLSIGFTLTVRSAFLCVITNGPDGRIGWFYALRPGGRVSGWF